MYMAIMLSRAKVLVMECPHGMPWFKMRYAVWRNTVVFTRKRKQLHTCVEDARGRIQNLRPADLLVDGDTFDRRLCVDVTIVSPLSQAKSGISQGRDIGKLVDQKAKEKVNKHDQACAAAGYDFQPFAMDVCGVVDDKAAHLLRRFSTRQAERTGRAYSYILALARRRISTALQVGISTQILGAFQPDKPVDDDVLSARFAETVQLSDMSDDDDLGAWERQVEEEKEDMDMGGDGEGVLLP